MKHLLPLSLLFLFGCPVEPKDIQDLNNNEGPGKPEGQMVDNQEMDLTEMGGGNPNMGGQGKWVWWKWTRWRSRTMENMKGGGMGPNGLLQVHQQGEGMTLDPCQRATAL